MNVCGWFEIPVTDIGRATQFYEQCFSVTLEKTEMGFFQDTEGNRVALHSGTA